MQGRLSQAGAASLRGISLAARFALTLGLAAIVSPVEVGVFGLYWAGLQLASSLMGLDVYATTTRELLRPESDARSTLRRHTGFVVLVVLLVTPLATLSLKLAAPEVPAALLVIFCLHLPVEYYCQELSRLLIPLHRPFHASLVLFIRSAAWTPLPFALIALFPQANAVFLVVVSWLFGSLSAAVTTAFVVKRATGIWNLPIVDRKWAKAAILSSGIFFLGSLVFRGMLGFDRFLVNGVLGIETVGIYTVQASVCLGALALVESGISAWWYPRLVNEIQAGNWPAASRTLRAFVGNCVVSALLLVGAIVVVFPVTARALIDPAYTNDLKGFHAMAVGVFLYASSMPHHYVLYGRGQDLKILCIYIVAAIAMMVWAGTLMKGMGVDGAGFMLGIALAMIACGRVLATRLGAADDSGAHVELGVGRSSSSHTD